MRGTFPDMLLAVLLIVLTIAATLVMGMTSMRFLPCCGDFIALTGVTSVTTVCVSRLFSESLGCAFFWATVMPSVACGVTSGLYVLYVPVPSDIILSLPNDLSTAVLDGILAAILTLPVGFVFAGCCVGFLKFRSRVSPS
tara:strand:- start:2824 stop:3243 length:420 start_codon:yes stop_codon:yes gene_type:complete